MLFISCQSLISVNKVRLTVRLQHGTTIRAHLHYQSCSVNTTLSVYTSNSGGDIISHLFCDDVKC
jgi:hypothetical protein